MSNPCLLAKDCNGNPVSTLPPCYAFQVIFTAWAPRLIQSISRNAHNKNRALRRLWLLISSIKGTVESLSPEWPEWTGITDEGIIEPFLRIIGWITMWCCQSFH